MTVNYTTNLSLGQPVTGTESGTWGDDVNNSVTSYLDIAISGSLALTSASFTANALTLTNTQGTSSTTNIGSTTAQYYVLRISSLAANVTITAPSTSSSPSIASKTYLVVNADPTYSVTVKASGQTGISIAAGERATVYYNGTDYIKVTSSIVSNLTGTLPVANGGTGVTTSTGTGNTVLSASPTFTGTPTLPTGTIGVTQSFGNSSTLLATTAFVQAALQLLYPVGSIYTATVSTNPNTLFGFGTWTAFSTGRMLIGNGSNGTNTFVAGNTGGATTTTLSVANLPAHTHANTLSDSGHVHTMTGGLVGTSGSQQYVGGNATSAGSTDAAFTGITLTNAPVGSGTAATTISPYIVVYMWQRTA